MSKLGRPNFTENTRVNGAIVVNCGSEVKILRDNIYNTLVSYINKWRGFASTSAPVDCQVKMWLLTEDQVLEARHIPDLFSTQNEVSILRC